MDLMRVGLVSVEDAFETVKFLQNDTGACTWPGLGRRKRSARLNPPAPLCSAVSAPDPLVWTLAIGKFNALYSLLQVTSPDRYGPALAAWLQAWLQANFNRLQAAWPASSHNGALATEALLNLAVTIKDTSLSPSLYGRFDEYKNIPAEDLYTVAPLPYIAPSLRAIAQAGDAAEWTWLQEQYRAAKSSEYRNMLLRALAAATQYALRPHDVATMGCANPEGWLPVRPTVPQTGLGKPHPALHVRPGCPGAGCAAPGGRRVAQHRRHGTAKTAAPTPAETSIASHSPDPCRMPLPPGRAPQMQAWQFIKDEWERITQLGTGSFLVQSLLRAVLESLPATDDMLADAEVRGARWTPALSNGRPLIAT